MWLREASDQGVSKGGGTPPFGQHGMSSDRPSAGRHASTSPSTTHSESSVGESRVQPEGTVTIELSERVRGGDRRVARREARDKRVTIRLSSGEADQLARVAQRYRLCDSGAIRAAIDMLDGAPPPKVVNRDVLRLIAAVNIIGVNVNQLTRQGWAGIEPEVDDLRDASMQLLTLAKEMSE